MIPTPTPDQAVHVLKILGEWTKRGWRYEVDRGFPDCGATAIHMHYTNPADPEDVLESFGVNHLDAICQATTVMQMLLEEFPEKP